MASKENSNPKPRRRRRFSWISSCFGRSPLSADSGNSETPVSGTVVKGSWFSRLRSPTKKRTVPVDVVVDATPGDAPKEKPASAKKSFFQKFRKDKSSEKCSSPHHRHHQPQNPAAKTDVTAETHRLQFRHVASKCDARSKPAPLYRVRDDARTGTRSSHPGSPEPGHRTTSASIVRKSNHKKTWKERIGCPTSSCLGLSVFALALVLTLLLGRACAIVCMSAYFYLPPRFRVATTMARNPVSRKGGDEIDMSSEEHKKRVVLMGLLQREGRRPSATIRASTR